MPERFLKILPFIFIFLLFLSAPMDPDLGWHFRYGQYFLTHHEALRENLLTYFLADYSWAHADSIYQIIITLVNNLSGFIGLSLFYGLMMILAYFFFTQFNPKIYKVNLILFLIVIFLGLTNFNIGIRPQFFTFLYLLIYFVLLKRSEEKPNLPVGLLFAIVLVMLLWANTHAGFFLGLALLSFSVIDSLVSKNYARSSKLFITLFSSILISLINPFNIKIYQWVFQHSQVPLKTLIAEWVPPSPNLSLLIITISTLVLSFTLVKFFKERSSHLFWILSLLLFTPMALNASRNLPLWGLTILLASINLWGGKLEKLELHPYFKKAFYSSLIVLILPLLVFKLSTSIKTAANWEVYCQKALVVYPCQAINFIRENHIKEKNIFNAYEWGGLLEWQLPENKFFVDGRMPAWNTPEGKSPYTIYLEILQAQEGYQKRLDTYGTDLLLIQVNTILDFELKDESTHWKEIYRDQVAVIYEKR